MAEPFSQILKRYKTENALTSREMAEIIGLSERMYAYYEKGEYDGQPSRIEKYLHKLASYKTGNKVASHTDTAAQLIEDIVKRLDQMEKRQEDLDTDLSLLKKLIKGM